MSLPVAYRRLLGAMLHRAVRDALNGDLEALAYLRTDAAREAAAAVGVGLRLDRISPRAEAAAKRRASRPQQRTRS